MHTDDVFGDLRVFLETEVWSHYHQAIYTHDIGVLQFGPLMDELVRLGAMLVTAREAIEPLRLTLNSDHHV